MAAITTTYLRVLNALNFKNEENLYLAIGRTSAWDSETEPPTPEVSQTEIEELIYIKKISIKKLVILDDPYDLYNIDVEVDGINYNYVLDIEAFDKSANKVYLSTTITYEDSAPTTTNFRQIGILRNPKDSNGDLLTDVEYLASSISDQGQLIYVDNRTVITRDPAQSERFDIILVF